MTSDSSDTRCDLCGQSCTETQSNLLACTYKNCEGGMYHQECLEKFLKSNRLEKVSRTPPASVRPAILILKQTTGCLMGFNSSIVLFRGVPPPLPRVFLPAEPQNRLQMSSRLRQGHFISGAMSRPGKNAQLHASQTDLFFSHTAGAQWAALPRSKPHLLPPHLQIDKSHPIYPRNEEKVKKRQVREQVFRSARTRFV